ncbi:MULTISPECIES: hypothetical protein [unclassified Microcoleus]|uniref:hypothetical protein n=1 Tax=unclassified Microcoleus TaxID=2642155 RepID=UPI002FD4039C
MFDTLSQFNFSAVNAIETIRSTARYALATSTNVAIPTAANNPQPSLTATLVQCRILPLERRIQPTHLVTLQ